MNIERRFLPAAQFRVAGEDTPKITGYAAVFNSLSENLGGFREIILPGAFAGSLGEDVRALWNHDANHVLGRTRAGTLSLMEDDTGLRVEITPPDSAADKLESMRRGDVDQMSFGFWTLDDEWRMQDGEPLHILKSVRLFDVSVVTYPAYPETEASVRSMTAFLQSQTPPDLSHYRARLRLAERPV